MAKVMVVDDAYPELKLMESILKSAGLEVVCLPDGDQLEERMVQEQLAVLPLDIVMPNRNGYEILRSLKGDSRTKHIRVVRVSSKNGESHRVWASGSARTSTSASPSRRSSSSPSCGDRGRRRG
jgi:CheY-like chemotaxis protein